MKNIILGTVFLLGFATQAQQKDRFNVGLHYRPPVGNAVSDFAGGADLRVRVISARMFNFGAGVSATYRASTEKSYADYVIFNPHVYAEIQPFKFALKPYLSLGYAAYNQKIALYRNYGPDSFDPSFSNQREAKIKYSGFTANAGARFDFAKFLYADLGLVYINTRADLPGNTPSTQNNGYGMVNVGFGCRF